MNKINISLEIISNIFKQYNYGNVEIPHKVCDNAPTSDLGLKAINKQHLGLKVFRWKLFQRVFNVEWRYE